MEDPSSVNSALFEFFADHPIITEPNCDFDSNGTCDIGDLDAIFRLGDLSMGVLVTNGEYDRYDLNTDLVIDLSDVGAWLSEAASANQLASPYLYGDANLDGRVDATDLNAIGLNWQTTDASSWASGDFDGDQIVDSTDLNSLALNWQAGVALAGPLGSAVPEPSTMNSLIYFGIVWISLRRRLPSIFRRFATS
jgi:hypothetical protein